MNLETDTQMSRMHLAGRLSPRLWGMITLPLVLIVMPAAILANMMVFFDDKAFFSHTVNFCCALFAIGASLAVLFLPEILRVTRTTPTTLVLLLTVAITIVGLIMAILVLLSIKAELDGAIALTLIIAGAAGFFYTFRKWTIWSAK